LLTLTPGCSVFENAAVDPTAPSNRLVTVAPEVWQAIEPGSQIRCVLISGNPEGLRPNTTGTVIAVHGEEIVLGNCTVTGYSMSATPILSDLPVIGGHFRSTGVGRAEVPIRQVSMFQTASVQVIVSPPPGYVAPEIDLQSVFDDEVLCEQIRAASKDPENPVVTVSDLPAGAVAELQLNHYDPDRPQEFVKGRVLYASDRGVVVAGGRIEGPLRTLPSQKELVPWRRKARSQMPLAGDSDISLAWYDDSRITTAKVLIPPPPDYVAPDLGIADRGSH